jgi:methylenetetrahydrofolate reductase (NADPH)
MTRNSTLVEALAEPGTACSFEFFPPKDDAAERRLWTAIRELEPLRPAFVSVTYGAGGSNRDRTIRVTERIASETTLRPVGHLTCVGHSVDELRTIIGQYADAGVRHVLALRGDPPGGPTQPWRTHPEGIDYAVQLVELVCALGDFCVGVAAFPEGHPEAADLDADARVLAAKARAGAQFAVTQFFFRAEDYFALVDRAAGYGCDIPVIPGIMPITNLRQVTRMAELSGSAVPPEVVDRLEPLGDDPQAVRAEGIEIATRLCDRLLEGGAPSLHFYTLNRSTATRHIHANLGALTG